MAFYGLTSPGVLPEAAKTDLATEFATTRSTAGLVDANDLANSSFLVTSTTVALGGDSITDGAGASNSSVDSYRAYLAKIVGTGRINVVEHGVPGENAAGLLARIPSIVASNPGVFVMQIGTNPSTDLAKYKSDVTAILNLVRDARIPTVINFVPASGAGRTDAAGEAERTNVYNMFLRYIAAQRGIPVADTFAATVDPATGYMRASYDADGTHPNGAGHLAIAKAVAETLKKVLPVRPAMVTAPGAPGLIGNPLMAGGTATTQPTGWDLAATPPADSTHTTGTVDPVAGDGLGAGQWVKMSIDATARTASATIMRRYNLVPVPNPGDVILITAQVKTEPGAENTAAVQFADGGTLVSIPGELFGVQNPGVIQRTYTIPTAGYAVPRVRISLNAPAGTAQTAYFGAVQAYNLTALGMTELAQ